MATANNCDDAWTPRECQKFHESGEDASGNDREPNIVVLDLVLLTELEYGNGRIKHGGGCSVLLKNEPHKSPHLIGHSVAR